jgi:hypothetical protein
MSPDSDALTRIARPIASRFLSMTIGLSLKRKFFTGWLILPFSIRNVPSRVRPVYRIVRGSSGRMYQKRVTRMPRSVERTRSSMVGCGQKVMYN